MRYLILLLFFIAILLFFVYLRKISRRGNRLSRQQKEMLNQDYVTHGTPSDEEDPKKL
ncbi:hypothetical protein P5G51_012155 [Virgibacillus sp. 179-BFC.A HS]|uniref:Uncharacterized protein n=1 Tax=Tigheibacillus jepli TaxID=3035914 RepID=A0ABU5CKK2_9BACI|nr:hypothetical protein [Virgibacillus sp. 179-BFC.A HS]MDY0406043.1 hypothetical protein [Virgibacillus sp. 179-BFC.A HS]